MHIALLIYGNLETVSGGYLYDRKLVEHLRSQGDQNPWKDRKFHTPSRLRKHKEKNTGQ